MLTTFEFFGAWLKAHAKSDRGASLVEYALLVALIAVVCIAAIGFLGRESQSSFNDTGSAIANAGS
jgi:pilus assembly protein Flp/PilA